MKWLFNVFFALLLVGAAAAGAWWLITTRPDPPKRDKQEIGALVETLSARSGKERVTVTGMGTVVPARSLALQSEVGGRVTELSPRLVLGGRLAAGEVVLRIEPRDYQYQVEQRKAQVEKALLDLKLEEGRQVVARREWEQLRPGLEAAEIDRELGLRLPQLQSARAALSAAQAALDKALLDLERTALAAPFDALVLEEAVEVGQIVGTQARIATLVAVDRFWVRAAIAQDRLGWIDLPGPDGSGGASARVAVEGDGRSARPGRVVRLLGDLDPIGRMARVLIEVENPLAAGNGSAGAPPLLLGAYVHVEIEGRELEGVFRLPRSALRDGNSVWLMDGRGRLEVRPVDVAWRDRQSVLIQAGLAEGDQVVACPVAAPVGGMLLRRRTAASGASR